MVDIVTVSRLTVTVPAGQKKIINAIGDFLFVESATSDCTARLEGRAGLVAESILIRSSASYKNLPRMYDRITLHNAGGTDAVLVLISGEGDFGLNLLAGAVTVATPTTFATDYDDQVLANGGTYDIPADADRVELILEADPNNTQTLIVRDADAATSRGVRLHAGKTLVLRTTGAVRVCNNSGVAGNQNLWIAEVKQ